MRFGDAHDLAAAAGEIGAGDGSADRYTATAEPLVGDERDRLYRAQCERDAAFTAYQAGTDRVIPVIAPTAPTAARPTTTDPPQHQATAARLVRAHNELREELVALRKEFDAHATGRARPAPSLGTQLSRHCLAFRGALHTHHTSEDSAFDVLERQFPDLGPALDRMRREHRVVARTLTDLEALLARSADAAGPGETASPRAGLERLATTLEDHFAYEEAELLPALLPAEDRPR